MLTATAVDKTKPIVKGGIPLSELPRHFLFFGSSWPNPGQKSEDVSKLRFHHFWKKKYLKYLHFLCKNYVHMGITDIIIIIIIIIIFFR